MTLRMSRTPMNCNQFDQRSNSLLSFGTLPRSLFFLPHRSNSACRVYSNLRCGGLFRRRHLEPITEPGLSADEFRLTWIGLKLPAELSNEDSEILRLSAVIRPPNRLKHHLMPD